MFSTCYSFFTLWLSEVAPRLQNRGEDILLRAPQKKWEPIILLWCKLCNIGIARLRNFAISVSHCSHGYVTVGWRHEELSIQKSPSLSLLLDSHWHLQCLANQISTGLTGICPTKTSRHVTNAAKFSVWRICCLRVLVEPTTALVCREGTYSLPWS